MTQIIKRIYMQDTDERLATVEEIEADLLFWQGLYKRRVFDKRWPALIQSILSALRAEIENEAQVCLQNLAIIRMAENRAEIGLESIFENTSTPAQMSGTRATSGQLGGKKRQNTEGEGNHDKISGAQSRENMENAGCAGGRAADPYPEFTAPEPENVGIAPAEAGDNWGPDE